MRPARSLHDLVARLDHRRRRYHRVRRLWGTGLGVLGGGLLLLGGWGTLPVSPRASVPAGARPAADIEALAREVIASVPKKGDASGCNLLQPVVVGMQRGEPRLGRRRETRL